MSPRPQKVTDDEIYLAAQRAMVTTPKALRTDRVSNALMELAPDNKGAVEWNEKQKDKIPK